MKSHNDLINEVKEIAGDIKHIPPSKNKRKKFNPAAIFIGLVLVLLIIMMVIPYYGIKLDPEPKNIPSISKLNIKENININNSIRKSARTDFKKLINPNNPSIKQIANKIATDSCQSNKICHAKAMFYFVKNNIQYVSDPPNEYLASAFETLQTAAGDCDDYSILLASLTTAVGIPTRLTFIPNHVFVQIKLDSARNKYKQPDGWITLDATCQSCKFGEGHYSHQTFQKSFIWIN